MSDVDWADITHKIALSLFGEPNQRLSNLSRGELRWHRKGSLSVLIYPNPKAGAWQDFEAGEGGGIFQLLAYGLNLDRDQALQWLRDQGYLDGQPRDVRPTDNPIQQDDGNRARRIQEAHRAALQAKRMINTAQCDNHPYLTSKGFPNFLGLTLNGFLLVPMWTMNRREIRAVQTIDAQGGKKFAPYGCMAANTVHFIGGSGETWWWCEGYATGLSIYEALKRIYRSNDRVAVAFSAGAIAKYAKRGLIVAEHDRYVCRVQECHNRWFGPYGETSCPKCGSDRISPPAGERAAIETGLSYWKPPNPGEDANDFWQREGTESLADALRDLIY